MTDHTPTVTIRGMLFMQGIFFLVLISSCLVVEARNIAPMDKGGMLKCNYKDEYTYLLYIGTSDPYCRLKCSFVCDSCLYYLGTHTAFRTSSVSRQRSLIRHLHLNGMNHLNCMCSNSLF